MIYACMSIRAPIADDNEGIISATIAGAEQGSRF